MRSKRLSSQDRTDLVRKIMLDVPKIDYVQQLNCLHLNASKEQLPEALKEAIRKDSKCLRHIHQDQVYRNGDYVLAYGHDYEITPEVLEAAGNIDALLQEQKSARRDMENHLRSALSRITTIKKLLELFPEFEKYIEGEIETPKALVFSIVEDLTEAGWPG